MKKQDLANIVLDIVGGTKTQSEEVIKALFDAMAAEMAKGGTVDIAGFGKFQGVMRDARTARNPRTGETVKVPAKRVPKFKAGKALKDVVAG
jgi:DNA-binding protein HU-beta